MTKKTPRYVAIYHELKSDIVSKKYPVGSYLPTETELEQLYGASRTTIRNAVAMLRDEHLVDVKQGKGTEVLPTIKRSTDFQFAHLNSSVCVTNTFLVDGAEELSSQAATIDVAEADSTVSAALGLELGERVYRLQRVKIVDKQVFCYSVSYVPCAIAPGLERYNGEITLLYKFLRETYGVIYTTSRMGVTAVSAGFLHSKLLNVAEGTPLLMNTRVAYTEDKPFEYNESVFRPDIMQITIDFSVLPPEHL